MKGLKSSAPAAVVLYASTVLSSSLPAALYKPLSGRSTSLPEVTVKGNGKNLVRSEAGICHTNITQHSLPVARASTLRVSTINPVARLMQRIL